MRLSPQKKLELVKRVILGESAVKICKETSISRTILYRWINKYKKSASRSKSSLFVPKVHRGRSHWKSLTVDIQRQIVKLAIKNPSYSPAKIAKIVKVGSHGVWNVLKRNNLSTKQLRENYIYRFGSSLIRPKEATDKITMIRRFAEGERVTDLCREFKVSRTIFYRWLKKYHNAPLDARLEALNGLRPKGETHWRFVPQARDMILAIVTKNPQLSAKKISHELTSYAGQQILGNHGVHNLLIKDGLNTYEKRLLYSQEQQERIKSQTAPLYEPQIPIYRLRQLIAPFTTIPKLIRQNPQKGLIALLFSLSPLFIFYFWIKLILNAPDNYSIIGLNFAGLSLLFGLLFFLYSLKYYLSIVMVLRMANSGGAGTQKPEATNKFSRIIDRFLYQKRAINPLLINFEKISLVEKPFVSIHVAVYNEKNVIERLISACTSQDWFVSANSSTQGESKPTPGVSLGGNPERSRRANYEVVLVDDSTDETTEMAKQTLIDHGWLLSTSSHPGVATTTRGSDSQILRSSSFDKLRTAGLRIPNEIDSIGPSGLQNNRGIDQNDKGIEIFVFSKPDGPTVKLIHRSSRSGFKGGALQRALEETDAAAEYIVVFDADFVPYADTIEQFVKAFQVLGTGTSGQGLGDSDKNSKPYTLMPNPSPIAAVQGYQWHVLNKSQTWVTRGVRTEYAGSYVIERSGEEIYGGLKQIAGSVYAIRADILRQFGWGTSITEDFELTLRLYEAGYKIAFTPYIQAPAEAVSTIKRLIRQRMRWAEGASFNIKVMLSRMLFGRWVEASQISNYSNYSNQTPNPKSQLGQLEIRSIRNSKEKQQNQQKVWVPSKLTLSEKLEFIYLAPYYLQAAFFVVGTLSWFISEAVFHSPLPFWTSAFGWSLVFTNLLSLPLMNIIGLFLEESDERDYLGVFSFIALSYIVVPFQAYAAVKGFLEREEGPWFRTPKSGAVTDVVDRSRFSKFYGNLFGRHVAAASLQSTDLQPNLALASAYNQFSGKFSGNLRIRPKRLRLVGRSVLVALLLFAISLNIVSFNQNGFFGEGIQRHIGVDQQTQIVGKDIFKAGEKLEFNLKIPKGKETKLGFFIKKILTFGEVQAAVPTVSASLIDSKGEVKDVSSNLTSDNDDFKLALSASGTLKPGKYTLKVEVKDAKGKFVDEAKQDFRWGVLALNVNKSIYTPDETVKLGFGMVDDVGKTICSAKLTLDIKKPDGQVDSLSSGQDEIRQSGQCGGSSVTNVADNLADYQVKELGTYSLHLKAVTENGPREIDDQFEVRQSVPFDIERTSYPTRIYPPADYPVKLTVVANEDFAGEVVETVPESFDIKVQSAKFKVAVQNSKLGRKEIKWEVDWQKGEKHELSYTIKFPRESPQFYLVGPIRLVPHQDSGLRSGQVLFQEIRTWQIAADVVTTKFMETPDATNSTTGDTGTQFWSSVTGTVTYDTSQKKSGNGSWKANSGAASTAYLKKSGTLADAGRRITVFVYFTDWPGVTQQVQRIVSVLDSGELTALAVGVNSDGLLTLRTGNSSFATGSSLSLNTWYRITLSYTIASSTVWEARLYLDGNLDAQGSNSPTLATTNGVDLKIGWGFNTPGTNKVLNFQHVYVDDSTALTDTGDIRVTAKLPTTAIHNNFDTTGGSGAVDERPISQTNYKQQAASTQVHQDYDIQAASAGDVDISGNTYVAFNYWVWAERAAGAGVTPKIIYRADTEKAITLSISPTLFSNLEDSATYPSAGASVIGMESTGANPDTFFYEGGVLVASLGDPVPELALVLAPLSFFAPKIIKSIQKGALVEDMRSILRRLFEMIKRMFAGAQSARVQKGTSRKIKKEKARRRRKGKKDG